MAKASLECQSCCQQVGFSAANTVQVLDGESEPERKTQLEAELKEKQTAFDTLMKQFEVRQGAAGGRVQQLSEQAQLNEMTDGRPAGGIAGRGGAGLRLTGGELQQVV